MHFGSSKAQCFKALCFLAVNSILLYPPLMAADFVQVNFRMPGPLKDRLEREAKTNGRSLTAEIVYRLETTLEMDSYSPSPNVHGDDTALELAKALVKRLKQQK